MSFLALRLFRVTLYLLWHKAATVEILQDEVNIILVTNIDMLEDSSPIQICLKIDANESGTSPSI